MLKTITLKNFRKHVDFTTTLGNGIQVIRAANEGGKSTILEAIGYALFGAKALRTPLEQVVTWGEDAKKLKVELVLMLEGLVYTIKRSKGGAEIVLNGKPFVTGQNEVTNFCSRMLGADPSVVNKLMLAGQNSIRGALEEGEKALSVLIEDLAQFKVFDNILNAAQSTLVLGSPSLFEERLKTASKLLEDAAAASPPEPDREAANLKHGQMKSALSILEVDLDVATEAAQQAMDEWQSASVLYLKRMTLVSNLERAKHTLFDVKAMVDALGAEPYREVDPNEIPSLKERIKLAEEHEQILYDYNTFEGLPMGSHWVGSEDSFLSEMKRNALELETAKEKRDELNYKIRTLKGQRFDSTTCSKCGQELPNLDEIRRKNAEIDEKVFAIGVVVRELETQIDVLQSEERSFSIIDRFARKLNSAISPISKRLAFDVHTWPPTPLWNGQPPTSKPENIRELRSQLLEAEKKANALIAAKARYDLLCEQLGKANVAEKQAELELQQYSGPNEDDMVRFTKVKDESAQKVVDVRQEIVSLKQQIETFTNQHEQEVKLWELHQARVMDAQKVVAECEDNLKVLAFNNSLMKKLRNIRPVVANKLWNTVLASVSVMFSSMRKEESWITKDNGGFKVNGQAVGSLSGSTLDILGLAIRCALLKTFVPQSSLLVLDEPMHGCDSERVESMLGFLKTVDFQQCLLVSHEEISESVADNIIQL